MTQIVNALNAPAENSSTLTADSNNGSLLPFGLHWTMTVVWRRVLTEYHPLPAMSSNPNSCQGNEMRTTAEQGTASITSRTQRRFLLCRCEPWPARTSLSSPRQSESHSCDRRRRRSAATVAVTAATTAVAVALLVPPAATAFAITTMRPNSNALARRCLVRCPAPPATPPFTTRATAPQQQRRQYVGMLLQRSSYSATTLASNMTPPRTRLSTATTTTATTMTEHWSALFQRSGSTATCAVSALLSTSSAASSSSSVSSGTGNAVPTGVDVVVIGGGHAGCEAAAASARTGARTVLVTQKKETIGELSCNPSIGGIGKGHLVREVDALDGVMGRVIDKAGIHFRMLNRSKGPAVRGPRAQADRDLYRAAMQEELMDTPNLSVFEGSVEDVLLDGDDIRGVVTADGTEIACGGVVVTTGTFLRGKCYIGQEWYWAGRHLRDSAHVEPPSVGLAETLEKFEFPLGRLKTGTPPRIDGNTIDWGVLEGQPSEEPPIPFSYLNSDRGVSMKDHLISCAKTYTNEETHRIVMANAHTLPQPSVDGVGPRYCPSIYKKVERFRDRTKHLSFLEPEGLNTNVVYPNGMSGPFPEEVQYQVMRSMKGLEEVEIIRPAYDVEYDYVDPRSCRHTLETKKIRGLFLAGQICGTTGYEEAAAQGIVAGANAGFRAVGRPEFIVGRDEGYIGVLIDDLVTKGADEPYRMFTSRAEYRLYLRADNADLRLTGKGFAAGLVGHERMEMMMERETAVAESLAELKKFSLTVKDWQGYGVAEDFTKLADRRKNAAEIVQLPDVSIDLVEAAIKDCRSQDRLLEAFRRQTEVESAYQNAGPEATLGIDKIGETDPLLLLEEMKAEAVKVPSDVPAFKPTPAFAKDTVEAACKYMNYMDRQVKEMEGYRKNQDLRIPVDLEYTHAELPSMSSEELEKLRAAKPETFAAASQLQGVTPHSLVYLYNHVTRKMKDRHRERSKEIVTHHFMEADEIKEALSSDNSAEQSSDPSSPASASSSLTAASAAPQ